MANDTGALIVIEGGDGSGKATQAEVLIKRLREEGKGAQLFSFPRYYDSRAGKLIGELLAGKHGDFMGMPPYVSSLPYILDRASAASDVRHALDQGIVICDRYTPSNLAHQTAKLPKDEQKAFIDFLEGLEYDELGIPKPDLVIYLSVPTDVSSDLISKKEQRGYLAEDGSSRDHAERNISHQDRTRAVYLQLADERDDWVVIDCAPERDIRSIDEIHEDVWNIVQEHLTA